MEISAGIKVALAGLSIQPTLHAYGTKISFMIPYSTTSTKVTKNLHDPTFDTLCHDPLTLQHLNEGSGNLSSAAT